MNSKKDPLLQRIKMAAKLIMRGEYPVYERDDIRPLTQEEIVEAKAFFPMDKFFIFGHARSGTTLLNRLVGLHPEVHSNRQAHFFSRPPYLQGLVASPYTEEWLKRPSVRWNRGQDLSPVVMRAAADFILERDARVEGKTIVGDKSPNNLVNGLGVRLMHSVYPDAKLLFIVRDGRDAVLSHRFQAFIDNVHHLTKADQHIREAFLRSPELYETSEQSLFTAEKINFEARSWRDNVQETPQEGKQLYGENFKSLRFEDLLADPFPIMQEIWAFLGADPHAVGLQKAIDETLNVNRDANWQVEQVGAAAAAIPKGRNGAWQMYFNDRDKTVFKHIAGEALVQWNYEKNLDW